MGPGHLPPRPPSPMLGIIRTQWGSECSACLIQALHALVHCTQTWEPHEEKENAGYPVDGERGPDHSWIHHLNHHARLKNNGLCTPLFSPHPVFYLSFLQSQLLDNVKRDTVRPGVNSRVSDSTDSLSFSLGSPFNRGKKKK